CRGFPSSSSWRPLLASPAVPARSSTRSALLYPEDLNAVVAGNLEIHGPLAELAADLPHRLDRLLKPAAVTLDGHLHADVLELGVIVNPVAGHEPLVSHPAERTPQ